MGASLGRHQPDVDLANDLHSCIIKMSERRVPLPMERMISQARL
jgi:hypothetical protein